MRSGVCEPQEGVRGAIAAVLMRHEPGSRLDRFEIIDLLENPRLARGDGIVAIPTLVRRRPVPMRTIIGDLSDTECVLAELQLRPKQP